MDYLVHVANVLYLFSYLMRDILWLRILTVVAASCLIPWFYFRPEPLLAPIYWNLLFTGINLWQIVVLLLERRPVHFLPHEQRLYEMVFRVLPPRDVKRLLGFAKWSEASPGERIVERNVWLDRLLLIYSGRVAVQLDDHRVTELHDGQFIGEMGFATEQRTSADVVAIAPTRYVWWPREALAHFLNDRVELRAAIELILGADLANKLRVPHTATEEVAG